jgi:pimeloyl-ACP methyl ester carboxylesterase
MKKGPASPVRLSHAAVPFGRARLALSYGGEGRLLLFIHAGPCDRRMWWSQLNAFAGHWQVAAHDRRGHGDTTCVRESFSPAADADAVMEALGADSAILVACGDGARVAVDYALAYPERVDGLVLVSPVLGEDPLPQDIPDVAQRLMDEIELARKGGDIDWLNRLQAHAWLDGPASAENRVGGNTRQLFLDMNGNALRRADPGRETSQADAVRRFRDIAAPVALVAGEFGFPHIGARCQMLAKAVPRSELVVMKGVADLAPLEAPARFNTLLKRVLKPM